jgi:hypothetical protein
VDEVIHCDGANTSSAAAFIGSWTPNGPVPDDGSMLRIVPTSSGNNAKIQIMDESQCLLVVENAEKSEMLCGQIIERVENR